MFVIKDPVVDITNFYNWYKITERWLKRKSPVPSDWEGKEIRQSKKDRQISNSADEGSPLLDRMIHLSSNILPFTGYVIQPGFLLC